MDAKEKKNLPNVCQWRHPASVDGRSQSQLGSRIMEANCRSCFLLFCFQVRSPSPSPFYWPLNPPDFHFGTQRATENYLCVQRDSSVFRLLPISFFFLPARLMMWSLSHIAMQPWVKCPSEARTQPWGAPAFIAAPAEVKLSQLLFSSSQMSVKVRADKKKKSPCDVFLLGVFPVLYEQLKGTVHQSWNFTHYPLSLPVFGGLIGATVLEFHRKNPWRLLSLCIPKTARVTLVQLSR